MVEAGVRTFVCMQQEVPPQGELLAYEETDRGFVQYAESAETAAAKIGDVDNLKSTLTFLHRPIVDFGVPSYEKLVGVIDELAAPNFGGGSGHGLPLYVHCHGGRGRAGTVACCLLSRWYGISGEEAIDRVSVYYGLRGKPGHSPETDAQFAMVKRYGKEFGEKRR